jgi:cell division protein FtsQ
MLVEDEPELLRSVATSRSRVEKEFLPEKFSERFSASRVSDIGNDVRVRRRLPVRKGRIPAWMKTRWGRIGALTLLLIVLAAIVSAALAVQSFLNRDPRFRIDTSDSIQTAGNSQLTRDELLSVFGADIGRNIFYVPLSERRHELEQIPWVEHATVMRILPNQLRVAVRERTPVAFVRVGDQVKLIDGTGVFLEMPPAMVAARHFSFPVVTGVKPSDTPAARARRMELYQRFVAALDSSGEHFSSNLSEVDLSDPEDVRVTVPAKSSDLLLHFGESNFLARYRIYQLHLSEWEQQYPQLAAVDLRYDSEVVLKMAGGGNAASASSSGNAAAEQTAPAPVKHAAASAAVSAQPKHVAARKHAHAAKKQAGRKKA